MLKKKLLTTLVPLLSLLLSACAAMPPDTEVCIEINPVRGWCTMTISDKEFFIDEENPYDFKDGQGPVTWWQIRPLMLYVPSGSYAKMKAYIIKTCKQNKCDKHIGSWNRRMERLEKKGNIKIPIFHTFLT